MGDQYMISRLTDRALYLIGGDRNLQTMSVQKKSNAVFEGTVQTIGEMSL